ncbi:MAG: glycosyltransferase family protein [Proteobacteria bacterium]|nr:glycosyltransferase family protein [Pseudomonadota bacterium]
MIAAIVQARMASSRLPGKVLKEVMGKPLLAYLIERLSFSKLLDKIILATTTNKEDDDIISFAVKEKILFYRGSENDVLDRYYKAAKEFQIGHIVRITSDCPLIDPYLCDKMISVCLNAKTDYVYTGPTFAEGLDCEVLSFKALEKAWKESILKSEREHVTFYIYNHPELFNHIVLHNETDDSKYRFTVDEPEDYAVVKKIIEKLYRKGLKPFPASEIKDFLDKNPDIFSLNARILRNEGLLKSKSED